MPPSSSMSAVTLVHIEDSGRLGANRSAVPSSLPQYARARSEHAQVVSDRHALAQGAEGVGVVLRLMAHQR